LATDKVTIIAECDAALGHDGVEFGEGVKVPVDDWLVDVDPQGLGRRQLWGVGRQVNEADALGDRERREGVFEQFLVDAGRKIPEALAGSRRDEGGDVEPFETKMGPLQCEVVPSFRTGLQRF